MLSYSIYPWMLYDRFLLLLLLTVKMTHDGCPNVLCCWPLISSIEALGDEVEVICSRAPQQGFLKELRTFLTHILCVVRGFHSVTTRRHSPANNSLCMYVGIIIHDTIVTDFICVYET